LHDHPLFVGNDYKCIDILISFLVPGGVVQKRGREMETPTSFNEILPTELQDLVLSHG